MGILGQVVLLPFAPVHGLVWLARLLHEMAANELDDPEVLRARLRDAEEAHRRGEISDHELSLIEDAIFERLMPARGAGGGGA